MIKIYSTLVDFLHKLFIVDVNSNYMALICKTIDLRNAQERLDFRGISEFSSYTWRIRFWYFQTSRFLARRRLSYWRYRRPLVFFWTYERYLCKVQLFELTILLHFNNFENWYKVSVICIIIYIPRSEGSQIFMEKVKTRDLSCVNIHV